MTKIITTYVHPPIPIRKFDWRAHYKRDDEGPVGWGETEDAAVADLMAQEYPCPDCERPNCEINH